MKSLCLILVLLAAAFGQGGGAVQIPPLGQNRGTQVPSTASGEDATLPNGKSRHDEIAKADHKRNIEDAAALLKLAEELKTNLEKDDAFVVSVKSMKQTEEIEKLAKSIRGRLKKY
jgi:hypothetical protein